MNRTWIDDFKRKYEKPQIEPITVGFSGIDPQRKCEGNSVSLDDLLEKLKELEIRIDSGNIEPDTPEPTPEPIQPVITSEDDHEKLKNLLGGNNDGHYHLTENELEKLQNLPEHVADGKAATIKVGTVTTGAAGTRASVNNSGTSTNAVLDFIIPRGEKGDTGATGAKGSKGDPFTYEDFTPAQLAALKGEKGDKGDTGAKGSKGDPFTYEDFTPAQLAGLKGEKGDKGDTGAKGAKGDAFKYEDFTAEQLAGLKGEKGDKGDPGEKGEKGDTFNFEDLTEEQLENLKDKIGSGVSDHEELTNLQGGTDNEHYHFTFAENYLTRTLLAGFFKLENESEPEDENRIYPASFTIDIGTYDPTPYLPYA